MTMGVVKNSTNEEFSGPVIVHGNANLVKISYDLSNGSEHIKGEIEGHYPNGASILAYLDSLINTISESN